MLRVALVTLLVLFSVAAAAPIPKSLKLRKLGGDPNGVWQLTKFISDGKEGGHETMAQYWEIDGELLFIGILSPDNRGSINGGEFKIVDQSDPDFRLSAGSPSRMKVFNNELHWVYTDNKTVQLAECEPGPNRYYYEFKRVK